MTIDLMAKFANAETEGAYKHLSLDPPLLARAKNLPQNQQNLRRTNL